MSTVDTGLAGDVLDGRDDESDGDAGSAARAVIAQRVADVMEKHGLPQRSRASKLAEILGISFSAARRKITGQAAYDVAQLEKLALHFGENMSTFVESSDEGSSTHPGSQTLGTFVVAGKVTPCTFWLGDVLPLNGPRPSYIAVQLNSGQWRVMPPEDAPEQRHYTVHAITMTIETTRPTTVAVVDDDAPFAEALADYMGDMGVEAIAYTSASEFLLTLQKRQFDGYVVDWNMGDFSGDALMKAIRAAGASQHAPIILLTGMMMGANGGEELSQLTGAIQAQNAVYMQKPTRNELITSSLQTMMLQNSARH